MSKPDGLVVDSSALLAMLLTEPDAPQITTALLASCQRSIGAFSLLEASVAISVKKGLAGRNALDALVSRLHLEAVPLTAEHTEIARDAWTRFGKGRHPAALNLGDCCSYAASRLSGLPLLARGADFPRTDVDLVAW